MSLLAFSSVNSQIISLSITVFICSYLDVILYILLAIYFLS